MSPEKRCVQLLANSGWVERLITFVAAHGYVLSYEEAQVLIEQFFEQFPLERIKETRKWLLEKAPELKLKPKTIESLAKALTNHGLVREAIALAKKLSRPRPLYDDIVMNSIDDADATVQAMEAVRLGVSRDVLRTFLDSLVAEGGIDLAIETARIGNFKLTSDEFEEMIRVDLESYRLLEDAEAAAEAAGRMLTTEELDRYIMCCMSHGDMEEAADGLKRLNRPFTDKEIEAFITRDQKT